MGDSARTAAADRPESARTGDAVASSAQPSNAQNAAAHGLGILFWLAVWFAVAAFVGNDLLLAGPVDTAAALLSSFADAGFWEAVANTTVRIVATGALSAMVGVALGALAYRFRWIREGLSAPLQVMKSAPVACVIVVVLVAWGASGALIVIVAFVALPPFYVAMQQALASRPRQTETVLRLAGVSRTRVFASCIWPAALPFFTAASKTAVALSWRAGITAELLCLPMSTIGTAVYASKLTLDSAELLALTVVVMVLSWACEKAVVAALDLSGRAGVRVACSNNAGTRAPCGKDADDFDARGKGAERGPDASAPSTASAAASGREAGIGGAPETAIVLEDVTKRYDDATVFEALSIRVGPGQRVCLMAPTGSGKSTAIRLMLGMERPSAGEVHSPERFGVVLQTPSLVEGLTALDNVMLAAGAGVTREQARGALVSLLPEGGCDRLPAELSGGMKRLVEIVRALLSDGQAIVLDESFAGLDAESHRRACTFIADTLRGRPLVVATHDTADAEMLDAEVVRL